MSSAAPAPASREVTTLQGLLLVLVPMSVLSMGRPAHGTAPLPHEMFEVLDAAGHTVFALLLLFAALTLRSTPLLARMAATLGVVGVAAFDAVGTWHQPTLAFVMLIGASALIARIWPPRSVRAEQVTPREGARLTANVSAVVALLAWWLAVPQEWARDPSMAAVAAATQILAAWHAHLALAFEESPHDRLSRWPTLAWVGLVGGAALLALAPLASVTLLALPPAVRLAMTRVRTERLHDFTAVGSAILANPARALVVTFGGLILVGSLLLSLPAASGSGRPVAFVDALFTSVSAVCVTGLTVIDTATGYSLFGQAVILVLIQIGGLGIMTFSAAAVMVLGLRTSVSYETTMADVVGAESLSTVDDALWRVFLITVGAEAVGAAILTVLFLVDGDPLPMALWRGVFHAISAFCNAGFAIQTTSLMPYQHHPGVLYTISALIIVGGLGPATVWFAPRWLRGRRAPLSAKLALTTTGILLLAGWLLFLALEWDNTLAGMSPGDRLSNAWFQGASPRTAGFNSIDYADCLPATWLLVLLLMFVGGSPGSTAGGLKTTTIAVLLASVAASLRGRTEALAFGRRMSHRSIYQATALTTAGFGVAGFVTFGLLLTQDMPIHVAIFEVVSALGTVGLTIGGTALLDDVGKTLIMAAMFAGRLGPLTLFLFLTTQTSGRPSGRPEEPVVVG